MITINYRGIQQFILVICSLLVFGNLGAQTSFDKEGHRGCRGLMPENTIPAMKKALLLGVNTLELDLHISKDGQVLISHDPYISASIALHPDGSEIKKKEEKSLVLYQLNYAEIRQFDVGSKYNPKFPQQQKIKTYKPLLSELIDSVEAFVSEQHLALPDYNIETKSDPKGDNTLHPEPEEFVRLMMEVILSRHIERRVIIQSFDVRTLEIIHRDYPSLRTSLLTANLKSVESNLKTLSFAPPIYSPYYWTVTKATVEGCHQRNILIIPWTVDDEKKIKKMKDLHVDGIISDYPDRL